MSRVLAFLVLVVFLSLPAGASAYTVHSELAEPCHEVITLEAFDRVRAQGLASWITPTGDDAALVDDLPVDVDTDLAGATLILANRDQDLGGHEPDDIDQLAPSHGDPDQQRFHCLRAPDDDGAEGSPKALARCREAILGRVKSALAGLGPDGKVDPGKKESFRAVLDLRGPVDVSLPAFYVHLGHALHSLQDAFTHHWRTSDHLRVTTVLNYVDFINQSYDEARDGPPHSRLLDECTSLDDFRSGRLETAKRASAELLAAALLPAQNDDERMLRAGAVLDTYFQVQAGCTSENDWCDAPENAYRDDTGCACGAAPASLGWGAVLFTLGASLWLARRTARRNKGRSSLMVLPFLAQAAPTPAPPDAVCPEGAPPIDVSPESPKDDPFPLGGYVAGGAALSNAAAAASVGARYRVSAHFLVGADVEWNPWFSRTTKRFRPGSTNAYGTFIVRFPMNYERINVRSTLQLGISRMNFDLYGVPEGTIGPYVGFDLVGLDFELARSLYLVVDPAHIAIPIPQTQGVPFSYPQYRVSIGFQFGA
jgi:hypothetical protein